tara:strand:+ start:2131 stop:2595 length:465 start_codon:yes stop_codon:yes gene_type:complete
MRKGALNHGADIIYGILIILIAIMLQSFYKEPSTPTTDFETIETHTDVTLFTTNFLSTTITTPSNEFLTGEETYGDLLFLALEDKENQAEYLSIFERTMSKYIRNGPRIVGGYWLKTEDRTTLSRAGILSQDAPIYQIPYKNGETISLQIVFEA